MDGVGIAVEVLAAVVGSVVVAVATVGAPGDPLRHDVLRVLRYSTGVRLICGFGAVVFGPVVCSGLVWEWFAASGDTLPYILAVSISALFAGVCWRVGSVRFELDDDGIRGRSALGRRREIAWKDLQQVRYSAMNAWVLRDRHGQVLRISRDLIGSDSVVTTVEGKLPEPVWRDAVAALRRFRR